MSENPNKTDPKAIRYAPGTDPVPEDQWIYEWPADSADWMSREPQGYMDGPLFPEPVEPGPVGDEEATDG